MNGADLAVLVVPFLDGSSNRVEAGTDLEELLVVFFYIGLKCHFDYFVLYIYRNFTFYVIFKLTLLNYLNPCSKLNFPKLRHGSREESATEHIKNLTVSDTYLQQSKNVLIT